MLETRIRLPHDEEELFGPVVTAFVYPEAKYEETLDLVDEGAPYGLTGAVFAHERDALELADEQLRYAAGNFYVNDKPTGAVVGQQPFGGARASGTNDKAGSMWNLIRWVSPRTIKETFVPPTDYRYPFMAPDDGRARSSDVRRRARACRRRCGGALLARPPGRRRIAATSRAQAKPVYVEPDAELRSAVGAGVDSGPTIHTAAPALVRRDAPAGGASNETDGDPEGVLQPLHDGLGRPGTYAVVVGGKFRAGERRRAPDRAKPARWRRQRLPRTATTVSPRRSSTSWTRSRPRSRAAASRPRGRPGDEPGSGDGILIGLLVRRRRCILPLLRRRTPAGATDRARRGQGSRPRRPVALADDVQKLEQPVEVARRPNRITSRPHRYDNGEQRLRPCHPPEGAGGRDQLARGGPVPHVRRGSAARRPTTARTPPAVLLRSAARALDTRCRVGAAGRRRAQGACLRGSAQQSSAARAGLARSHSGRPPVPYWNAPRYFGPWAGGSSCRSAAPASSQACSSASCSAGRSGAGARQLGRLGGGPEASGAGAAATEEAAVTSAAAWTSEVEATSAAGTAAAEAGLRGEVEHTEGVIHSVFDAIGVFFGHLAAVEWKWIALGVARPGLSSSWPSRGRGATSSSAAYPERAVRCRRCSRYVAGTGVNAIIPARGGDVVSSSIAKRRIEGSTYTTLVATILLQTLFDLVVADLLHPLGGDAGRAPGSRPPEPNSPPSTTAGRSAIPRWA